MTGPGSRMRYAPRKTVRAWRHPVFGLATFHFGALIICFTILRLVLFLSFEPAAVVAEYLKTFLVGWHRALAVALFMTLPLVIGFVLLPHRLLSFLPHRML